MSNDLEHLLLEAIDQFGKPRRLIARSKGNLLDRINEPERNTGNPWRGHRDPLAVSWPEQLEVHLDDRTRPPQGAEIAVTIGDAKHEWWQLHRTDRSNDESCSTPG